VFFLFFSFPAMGRGPSGQWFSQSPWAVLLGGFGARGDFIYGCVGRTKGTE